MNLPHGDKKVVGMAFFAEGTDAEDARAAGADIVGGLELIEEIASSGKIDIERCFSTHQLMPCLFKVSSKEELLCENVGAFINAPLLAKPTGLKKTLKFAGYENSFHLCSTVSSCTPFKMGTGFPVSIQSLSQALDQYNKIAH